LCACWELFDCFVSRCLGTSWVRRRVSDDTGCRGRTRGLGDGSGRARLSRTLGNVVGSAFLGMQQCLSLRDLGGLGALRGALLFQGLTRLLGHSLPGRFIRHRRPLIWGPVLVPVPRVYAPSARAGPTSAQNGCQSDCRKRLEKKTIHLPCGLNSPELVWRHSPPGGSFCVGCTAAAVFLVCCTEVRQHVTQEHQFTVALGMAAQAIRCHQRRSASSLRHHAGQTLLSMAGQLRARRDRPID